MTWHYVDQGNQAGPVTDEELAALYNEGKITNDTLVWRNGLAQWVPYKTVRDGGSGAPAEPGAGEVVCVECGNIFPASETIRHGNVNVCANCKPVFLQKLSEGAKLNPLALNYAPVTTRFGAVFLDGLMLGVINVIMNVLLGVGIARTGTVAPMLQLVLFLIQLALAMSYETFMIGKYGATLGKMACRIKVVTSDGGQVSYMRAFGRYFAKQLSCLTLLVGYIMACFDKENRALHDRICDTRVVIK